MMIIANLIIVLLAIIFQLINVQTMTRTLRFKDSFMYLRLISNDYVFRTVKPYKMKILMYNRIFLLAMIVIAPLFVWLNNSSIILLIYIIIFTIIPFIINQYFVVKYANEFKSLNISHDEQPCNVEYLGLLFNDENMPIFYSYGYYRYILNYNSIKGKALIAGMFGALLIILICIVIFVKPINNITAIETTINDKTLTITYNKQDTILNIADITAIKKVNELPNTVSKIEGVQENNYMVGIFNLQGYDKVNVMVKKDSAEFLIMKANKKYYIYSESDSNNINKIYNEITQQLKTKKK